MNWFSLQPISLLDDILSVSILLLHLCDEYCRCTFLILAVVIVYFFAAIAGAEAVTKG
jgi:hypothetical protein